MIARKRPPSTGGRVSAPSDIISEAIRRHALLQFHYDDHLRVVAPYCYGVSTRGADSLRAIQVRGSSLSNALGFGKLWTVSKMRDLRMLEETFTPDDPNYNPEDKGMKKIYCRI
ncbi:hypothetical protein [Peristeroidobacter soli]|jgi:hypothetical protein|uniref:hypothetical protein n=1 Tax=Peristeroidobacter soli TaxID=2497877 RepID=UPI00101D0608|nr:hypothetical protein [Peristeroidobacter soli]